MKTMVNLLSIVLLFQFASCTSSDTADHIYYHAKIWTGDSLNPTASVLAVKGNTIVYVGNDLSAVKAGKAVKTDLGGQMLVPGFIDNHTHFLSGGYSLTSVQLKEVTTQQGFIETIKNYCKNNPGNSWIQGGEWNNDAWGGELPARSWIDSVTGNHPLCIERYDGHMILANSLALEKAHITTQTPVPFGGAILKDNKEVLTGILKDEATNLVYNSIPEPSPKELDQYLVNASLHAVAHGITQVHDVSSYGGWPELETYSRAYKKDSLLLRIYTFVPLKDWKKLNEYVQKNGKGDAMLRWGALKGFVDGSLGSTTAWFYDPYLDEPNTSGLNVTDTNDLKSWVKSADSAGLQVAVHAIGDRANDFILTVFESAQKVNGNRDRRFRVEHAQHLTPSAMDRFKQLSVIPSMQPYHVVDDGCFAGKRLEDRRLQGTYAFKSLVDKGIPVTFGSDWTVAPLNPILGIYAAVTRRTSDGKNPAGWYPAQKLTVEQALKCYTANNAYAGFQENIVGKLKKGMLADFVVIDQDLFSIAPEKIKDAEIVLTVINGKVVYKK
jgi:predicted amidohydrolase YtcJ